MATPLTLTGLLLRYEYQTLTPTMDRLLRQRLLTMGHTPSVDPLTRKTALDLLLVLSLTTLLPPDGQGLHPAVAPGDALQGDVRGQGEAP